MSEALRLGIAGLGTVGAGVVKILDAHGTEIADKTGRAVRIEAVSARAKNKKRDVDLSRFRWTDDPLSLAADPNVDVVVELIGGAEGTARELVTKAIANGKHVITANKALLAHHGLELAAQAERRNVSLCYEAAVAGGIPIIKLMREGYAANEIQAVYGILNGTCNYILTEMRETGRDFADVLKDAQAKGYAEADPTFDIDGIDAAHKLCLLTGLAFGVQHDFKTMSIQGIRNVTGDDIKFALEMGFRIKLLGITRRMQGQVIQTVEPCLVPAGSTIGAVDGVFNAVYVEGDFVNRGLIVGRGAGEGPTASAVVADVIDLARGFHMPAFGYAMDEVAAPVWGDVGDYESRFYLRLTVLDRPGVIADVSAILRDHNISIEGLLQRGRDPEQPVPIVMTTHEARQADFAAACELIGQLPAVAEQPRFMRIMDL